MPDPDSRPTPDPTVLTTEALIRAVNAERDYVNGQVAVLEERLRAIDVATRLLNESVNRTPTDIQKEIVHLRELSDVKFESIATQFKERDTRAERESRDNKVAVEAAFAAQKEAASERDKSNTLAIGKSETGTSESINKLSELFSTSTGALSDKIDDQKSRLAEAVASLTMAISDQGSRLDLMQGRDSGVAARMAALVAGVTLLIGVAAVVVAIIATR